METKLYRNFSWNLIGSLIYAFTQYFIIIVIGRFGSSEILGLYSLGLALTAPIMMFTNLQLRTVQSTGYAKEFHFKNFAYTRIISNSLFLILATMLLLLLDYNLGISLIILMIAISKILESFSDLYYGKLQYNERLDIVAKSYILRGTIGTFLFTIIFILTENLVISLTGLIISWTIVLIFYDIRKTSPFISSSGKWSGKSFKNIVIISFPLGILSLLGSLNVNLPRIIIEQSLTLKELGYFTSVFYLTIIMGKFVTSLGAAFLPRLSKYYEDYNFKAHLNLSVKFSVMIIFIGIILLVISGLFGNKILGLLYGNEFLHLGSFLFLVMIYGMFNYLLYSIKISLESTRTFKPQLYVEILNITMTLILSIIWIPQLGIEGAIYALIISSFLSCILLTIIYVKIYLRFKRGVSNKKT